MVPKPNVASQAKSWQTQLSQQMKLRTSVKQEKVSSSYAKKVYQTIYAWPQLIKRQKALKILGNVLRQSQLWCS